jgi:DNA polymerase-3 subunit epsilon
MNGLNAAFVFRSCAPSQVCVYGLEKLCEIYEIELETHHRALCDARATSFLLNLINQKREAGLPSALEDAA